MKWFKKYTQAEYSSASGSVVNPSVVLAGSEPKFGGKIAISDNTNKPLMDALRNNNVIASDKTYITVEEAGQITSLPNFALFSTGITSMEELRFFTGLTTWGIQIAGNNGGSDCLTKYALPPTITSLANQALQSRSFIKKIVFPDKSKYGNGVSVLPQECIKQNYNLRLLVLPSTLTTVNNNNFNRLGWAGSNSPINSTAFTGTTPCALTVICKATTPPTVNSTNNSFLTYTGGYDYTGVLDLKIYVPDGSVNTYKAATWWTQYANYILPISSCGLKFYDFFSEDFQEEGSDVKPYDAEVQYLTSHKTEWIDTGIIPNASTGLHIKASMTDDYDSYMIGLRNDTNNTRWGVGHSEAFYWCYGGYQSGSDRVVARSAEMKLNYLNDKKFVVKTTSTTKQWNLPTLSFTPSYNIRIFGAAGSVAPSAFYTTWKGTIYFVKITQGDNVLMDLIPVRKNGVGYMYDRISKQMLGNVSGSGSFAYGPDVVSKSITYTLTHLTATVKPTSVALGGSATIAISPEENHQLPLAVRVTNATLDSYNKSTGQILISNVTGNVEIIADAICTDYRVLWPGSITDYSGTYYCIAMFSNGQSNNRACVVLPRNGLVNACTWGASTQGNTSSGTTAMTQYSTIPIPYGAQTLKLTCTNTTYNISSGLFNASGANQKTTAWDTAQSSARTYTLSQYPNATHLGLNFKLANNGDFPSAPTLSQLGLSIVFE